MNNNKKPANMLSEDSVSTMFTQKSDNYFTRNHIFEYLRDAVEQLLESKNRASGKQDVLESFAEYFKNVKKGYHVMFREFKFVMLTPYNRACFVKNVYESFNYIGFKGGITSHVSQIRDLENSKLLLFSKDILVIEEYHSLIQLLCNDFPISMLQDCEKILNIDVPSKDAFAFKDFIFALQIQIYYDEFIHEATKVYHNLLSHEYKNSNDTVNSKIFYENIELLCSKANYSTPPLAIIKELLSKESIVKFYEFLNKLSRNESINNLIEQLQNAIILCEERAKKNTIDTNEFQKSSDADSSDEQKQDDEIDFEFTRSLSKLMKDHHFSDDKRNEVISKLSMIRFSNNDLNMKSSSSDSDETESFD